MVKRFAGDQGERNVRAKKARHEQPITSADAQGKFATPEDIQACLKSNEVAILNQGLTTLRNQLSLHLEGAPGPQDERIILAKNWLERYPGARDIFSLFDRSSRPTPNIVSLSLSVLSNLLNLLSVHFIYHPLGLPIVKNLLSTSHMRQLNSNLAEGTADVILSTLKLLNAMSTFAGGVEKRSLMDGFAWGQKSLQKLLFLRRKTKGQDAAQFKRPDIRTLYIGFILSFLLPGTPTQIKLSLLEQHRDTFLLIFKGISQDAYNIVRQVLEVCWEGIWSDNKIKRTLKIGLFNEATLHHLLKLYDRGSSEDDQDDHIPADLVHHFMLAIMTHRGVGICFKDRGWYPRETDSDGTGIGVDPEEDGVNQRGKFYNKILANVVKGLKVNEDPRQQELTFKILQACPELVSGYWSAVNLTLEPRLASRWIINISVLRTIISFPVPSDCFLLPNSQHTNPSPPPLNTVLSNCLPPVLNKTFLTKGLQSTSSLVQHCTALALTKGLSKLDRILLIFREIATKLEEEEENGQWLRRIHELEIEAEKRVPEFTVIVGMVQQKATGPANEGQTIKMALLSEAGLRLLWFYHKLFPRVVSGIKFDAGKLLLNAFNPSVNSTAGEEVLGTAEVASLQESSTGMDVLRQLHVLRLLKESDQFGWLNKFRSSPQTNLYAILTLYSMTSHPDIRLATSELLTHVLISSILFSHDTEEIPLWLHALPQTRRSPVAVAPDDTPLTDEVVSVLSFLDDSIQRCSKTPYRYLEENAKFFEENQSPLNQTISSLQDDPKSFPSPLLMTVLEQLRAKMAGKLLSSSDILSIVTFVRKLTVSLATKLREIRHAWKVHEKLDEILSMNGEVVGSDLMKESVKHEMALLADSLRFIENPFRESVSSPQPVVQEFLNQVEGLPTPASPESAAHMAYELVDWMRMVHVPRHATEIKRLFDVVIKLSIPAARAFLYQLEPALGQIWTVVEEHTDIIDKILPFELALLHSFPEELAKKDIQDCLISLFYSSSVWNSSCERRISTLLHRLRYLDANNANANSSRRVGISFLAGIFHLSRVRQVQYDLSELKRVLFSDSAASTTLLLGKNLPPTDILGLASLVSSALEIDSASDQALARSFCIYWTELIQTSADISSCMQCLPWIPFMTSEELIPVLDKLMAFASRAQPFSEVEQSASYVLLETLTRQNVNTQFTTELQRRISGLLSLRRVLSNAVILDRLLLPVVESGLPIGYNRLPLFQKNASGLSTITKTAEIRWSSCISMSQLEASSVQEFINPENWSTENIRILSAFIYRSPNARQLFWTWFSGIEKPGRAEVDISVIPLHSLLDVTTIQGEQEVWQLHDGWIAALIKYIFDPRGSADTRSLCVSSILLACSLSPSARSSYTSSLTMEIRRGHPVNRDSLALLDGLRHFTSSDISSWMENATEWILKWMVDQFTGDSVSDEDVEILEALLKFFNAIEIKTHLVEPVLKAAVQNCLHMAPVIRSIVPLIGLTHLKPMIVNRQLQAVVQHAQLYRAAGTASPARLPIIRLLHALFHTHRFNTCQPSHITPLIALYGGTLSQADQSLLSIFYLYEKQRKEPITSLLHNWSPSGATVVSHNILDVVIDLDANKVFKSCINFPSRRDPSAVLDKNLDDINLYDPLFLCLLASQLLIEHKSLSTTEWVQVFRSNIFSIIIRVLTSRNEEFRKIALAILGGLLIRVQEGEFLERDQTLYVLNILADVLPPPSFEPLGPRLPSYTALLLAHSLRCIFYPSSFLYPLLSRFLLQRPEFDLGDVPMLYSMLYSSEDGEWNKERTWMIHFLTEAMDDGSSQDWLILKRRHTWDLLASIWQSSRADEKPLRKGILEFLANISSNQHAISFLVIRSSLLHWIEIQLQGNVANETEYLAFAKILENIALTMEFGKAEKATQGEYATAFIRCLLLISRAAKTSNTPQVLSESMLMLITSRVLQRLSIHRSLPTEILGVMLEQSLANLRSLEDIISWKTTEPADEWYTIFCQAPHRAKGLFESVGLGGNDQEYLNIWVQIVVALWKTIMASGVCRKSLNVQVWNSLTSRMLVISTKRGLRGEEDVAEWTRKEAVSSLLGTNATE